MDRPAEEGSIGLMVIEPDEVVPEEQRTAIKFPKWRKANNVLHAIDDKEGEEQP